MTIPSNSKTDILDYWSWFPPPEPGLRQFKSLGSFPTCPTAAFPTAFFPTLVNQHTSVLLINTPKGGFPKRPVVRGKRPSCQALSSSSRTACSSPRSTLPFMLFLALPLPKGGATKIKLSDYNNRWLSTLTTLA